MHETPSFFRILFFIPVVLLGLGIFSLITWRGSVAFGFSLTWKTIVILAVWLLFLLIGSMTLASLPWNIPGIIWAILLWCIYTLLVLSPLFLGRDLLSVVYKIPPVVMIVLCVFWILTGIFYGTQTKITPLTITNTQIKQERTIVFLSDLHVDGIRQDTYIQKIVQHIQNIKPDLVLLGWDIMNIAHSGYVKAFEPFNQLSMPIYATLGNHDKMGNSAALSGIFSTTKIIPLRNQSIIIEGIQIVGIDDKSYWGKKTLSAILDESKIQKSDFTILVSHQPQRLEKLTGYPIDLELAGHTHNGQFLPMSFLIRFFNDYSYGEYHTQGKTAFVSQGVGAWGAPIRIGTQSEIVVVSLKKK